MTTRQGRRRRHKRHKRATKRHRADFFLLQWIEAILTIYSKP